MGHEISAARVHTRCRSRYNPDSMSFSTVRDQDIPLRLLRNILRRGRIPNGLLFWGLGGVGKMLAALEMAKAVNCPDAEGDACDACLSCRKVMHGNHPDVKIVAPAGKTRIINVETVEEINELCAYRPFEGGWRVIVVQDAERMNVSAQNHLLKTLEEPPSNTLFILVSEFPRILLPTIRSRCQQVRFGALKPETVLDLLLQHHPELPRERAAAIASVAQGQMSRALDLIASEKRTVVLDLAARMAAGEDPLQLSEEFARHVKSAGEAIKAEVKSESDAAKLREMTQEEREAAKEEQDALIQMLTRRDLMEYLYLLQAWYRDELVLGATRESGRVWNQDAAARLQGQTPLEKQGRRLEAIDRARDYIERNLKLERVFRDLFFVLAA